MFPLMGTVKSTLLILNIIWAMEILVFTFVYVYQVLGRAAPTASSRGSHCLIHADAIYKGRTSTMHFSFKCTYQLLRGHAAYSSAFCA